jgi:hypothetical protein
MGTKTSRPNTIRGTPASLDHATILESKKMEAKKENNHHYDRVGVMIYLKESLLLPSPLVDIIMLYVAPLQMIVMMGGHNFNRSVWCMIPWLTEHDNASASLSSSPSLLKPPKVCRSNDMTSLNMNEWYEGEPLPITYGFNHYHAAVINNTIFSFGMMTHYLR